MNGIEVEWVGGWLDGWIDASMGRQFSLRWNTH